MQEHQKQLEISQLQEQLVNSFPPRQNTTIANSGNSHLQKALGSTSGSFSSLPTATANSFNNSLPGVKNEGGELKLESDIQIKKEPSDDSQGGKPVPGLNSVKVEGGLKSEVKSEPFDAIVKQEDMKAEVKQENGGGDNSSDVKQEKPDVKSRNSDSNNASAPPPKPRVKKGTSIYIRIYSEQSLKY